MPVLVARRVVAASPLLWVVFGAACLPAPGREPVVSTIVIDPNCLADAAACHRSLVAADRADGGDAPDVFGAAAEDAAGEPEDSVSAGGDIAIEPADSGADAGAHADVDACIKLKVWADQGATVIPGTTLTLHAEASDNACPLKSRQWSVVQPIANNQALQPAAIFPNPVFTALMVGGYEFCAVGKDACGRTTCEPSCTKVEAVPDKALYVELIWSTPADADELDTGPGAGADLDLHVATELAKGPDDQDCDGVPDPWFHTPFDAFWFNTKPAWSGGAASGLLLDDPDGAGPELFAMDAPKLAPGQTRVYDIGVHYWHDHGYGKSVATVRLYLQGTLVAEVGKIVLKPLDLWHVGRVTWPNTMTGGSALPVTLCQSDGHPCGGGSWWHGKGPACITHCYVPKGLWAVSPKSVGCKPATPP